MSPLTIIDETLNKAPVLGMTAASAVVATPEMGRASIGAATIAKVKDYLQLCKPRITFMVTLTAAIGFFLAQRGLHLPVILCLTLLGTLLVSAGSAVLNNYLEKDSDALMQRTCQRPLPSGRVGSPEALLFGIGLILGGTSLLVSQVNLLTGFIALLTAFLYVLVYTPLKRVTWLNTFVGAIPGALPPVGGWTAASDELELGACLLFLILFVWQLPHFYSIAWMFRADYARAGLKMLPVVEPDGASTFRQIIIFSALLVPIAALPTIVGIAGYVYLFGILGLSLLMLRDGLRLAKSASHADARRLLHSSILFMPCFLLLIVAEVCL